MRCGPAGKVPEFEHLTERNYGPSSKMLTKIKDWVIVSLTVKVLCFLQDTLRSSPAENKAMKRASLVGVSTTTFFYILCGCIGYAAFGNNAPGDFLTDFGFFEPFWLIDFANACIAVHLIGAYQVKPKTIKRDLFFFSHFLSVG